MVDNTLPQQHIQDGRRDGAVLAENVSFDNFLQFFGEHHAEWIVGKVISVVSNNKAHQLLLVLLTKLIGLYLDFKQTGQLFSAGYPMLVHPGQPAREPDLIVLLTGNSHRAKQNYLDGPADVVVEIVSPESGVRDRGDKFEEYEAAGVSEYWLFDPLRKEAIFYLLGTDGLYHPVPLDGQGRLQSSVLPGFTLSPALLWRDEPPNGAEIIALVQGMVEQ